MSTTGSQLSTHFAPSERADQAEVADLALRLRREPMLEWLNTLPMAMTVINRHRQILHCNDLFKKLTPRQKREDVLGLRPGEALQCVHSDAVEAGCGCSKFCSSCGAAKAIVKSLNGTGDCQECRMTRYRNQIVEHLDLQVFTQPVTFAEEPMTIFYVMDVSHELRLRYLNRVFYHGLINGVGGIATLTELLESEDQEHELFPLLTTASKRVMRDILYHRDLNAAEQGSLSIEAQPFAAKPLLERLVREECEVCNMQSAVITLELEDSSIELNTDERLLKHVLRNLLANCLEASEGNTAPIILTCGRVGRERVRLTLQNPGEIPPEMQRQMFKRYVSTKSRDRGLGLYVVRLLVERYLGGQVRFTSKNGTTTFEVELPTTPPNHGNTQ